MNELLSTNIHNLPPVDKMGRSWITLKMLKRRQRKEMPILRYCGETKENSVTSVADSPVLTKNRDRDRDRRHYLRPFSCAAWRRCRGYLVPDLFAAYSLRSFPKSEILAQKKCYEKYFTCIFSVLTPL